MQLSLWIANGLDTRTALSVAKRAKVSRDTVYNAIKGVPMTERMAKAISRATKGEVTPAELVSPKNPVARRGWRCSVCAAQASAPASPEGDVAAPPRRAQTKRQQ